MSDIQPGFYWHRDDLSVKPDWYLVQVVDYGIGDHGVRFFGSEEEVPLLRFKRPQDRWVPVLPPED